MAPRRTSIAGPAPTRLRWARRRPRRACHAHLARTRRRGRALPTSACAMSALLAAMAGLVESAWPERTNLHLARQHAPKVQMGLGVQRLVLHLTLVSPAGAIVSLKTGVRVFLHAHAMPGTLEQTALALRAVRVTIRTLSD